MEFESGTLHLRRAKGGATSTHPLLGDELRALRALKREAKSLFQSVMRLSRSLALPSWSNVLASRLSCPSSATRTCSDTQRALRWPIREPTPGLFRRISGKIQSTVRYTELAPGRFKNLWR